MSETTLQEAAGYELVSGGFNDRKLLFESMSIFNAYENTYLFPGWFGMIKDRTNHNGQDSNLGRLCYIPANSSTTNLASQVKGIDADTVDGFHAYGTLVGDWTGVSDKTDLISLINYLYSNTGTSITNGNGIQTSTDVIPVWSLGGKLTNDISYTDSLYGISFANSVQSTKLVPNSLLFNYSGKQAYVSNDTNGNLTFKDYIAKNGNPITLKYLADKEDYLGIPNLTINSSVEHIILTSDSTGTRTWEKISLNNIVYVSTEAELVTAITTYQNKGCYIYFLNNIFLSTNQTFDLSGIVIDGQGYSLIMSNYSITIISRYCNFINIRFDCYNSPSRGNIQTIFKFSNSNVVTSKLIFQTCMFNDVFGDVPNDPSTCTPNFDIVNWGGSFHLIMTDTTFATGEYSIENCPFVIKQCSGISTATYKITAPSYTNTTKTHSAVMIIGTQASVSGNQRFATDGSIWLDLRSTINFDIKSSTVGPYIIQNLVTKDTASSSDYVMVYTPSATASIYPELTRISLATLISLASGKPIYDAYSTLVFSSTVNWDCNEGLNRLLTSTGNFTLNLTNLTNGMSGDLILTVTNTTTITLPTGSTLNGTVTSLSPNKYHLAWTYSSVLDFNIAIYTEGGTGSNGGGTYSVFTGSSDTYAGTAGLVPAPAIGDNLKFLRGDGTWQTISSSPTYTFSNGLTLTDNNVSLGGTISDTYLTSTNGNLNLAFSETNKSIGLQVFKTGGSYSDYSELYLGLNNISLEYQRNGFSTRVYLGLSNTSIEYQGNGFSTQVYMSDVLTINLAQSISPFYSLNVQFSEDNININPSNPNFVGVHYNGDITKLDSTSLVTKQYVANVINGLNLGITSEADPIFVASPAYAITNENITSWNSKEASLGNPANDNYILSSTKLGARSWVAMPTSAVWGNISGTLSAQTDLTTALNGKEPSITAAASAAYYWNGSKQWTAFPTSLPASDVYSWAKATTKPSYTTDEVSLGVTNKYYTNALTISSVLTGFVTGSTFANLASTDTLLTAFQKVDYDLTYLNTNKLAKTLTLNTVWIGDNNNTPVESDTVLEWVTGAASPGQKEVKGLITEMIVSDGSVIALPIVFHKIITITATGTIQLLSDSYTSRYYVIESIVLIGRGVSLTGQPTFSIGCNSTSYNDIAASQTLTITNGKNNVTLTTNAQNALIQASNNMFMNITTAAIGNGTFEVIIKGYLTVM